MLTFSTSEWLRVIIVCSRGWRKHPGRDEGGFEVGAGGGGEGAGVSLTTM